MRTKLLLLGLCVLLLNGCPQVPKESVELSTTVGRDIAVTHKAHIQLAMLLFERMRQDVNRFIDGTYAPYQIKKAMERQKELAYSDDQGDRNKSLLLAINAAFKAEASEKLQSIVLTGMGSFITIIRNDIEQMRSELLNPLNEQEEQVLGSINRAYQQMHYANSIVTGHLSSIVKVHDAQSDMLEEFGVERDLQKDIGEGIAGVSERINLIVDSAEKVENRIDAAESTAESLKSAITELGQILTD